MNVVFSKENGLMMTSLLKGRPVCLVCGESLTLILITVLNMLG